MWVHRSDFLSLPPELQLPVELVPRLLAAQGAT